MPPPVHVAQTLTGLVHPRGLACRLLWRLEEQQRSCTGTAKQQPPYRRREKKTLQFEDGTDAAHAAPGGSFAVHSPSLLFLNRKNEKPLLWKKKGHNQQVKQQQGAQGGVRVLK